jgi:hypothetical protein
LKVLAAIIALAGTNRNEQSRKYMNISTAQHAYCNETTMALWQPPNTESLAIRSGATGHLWCEILPITLHSGQIMYIQRSQDTAAAWHEPYDGGAHPSDIVRTRVEAFFGSLLDPRASVVHSTAWRYEYSSTASGRLILTYLAVLPSICCAPSFPAGQLTLQPLGAGMVARSRTLGPPEQVALQHILAHGLDHLTLLLETDFALWRALGPQWRAALALRQHRPAGELRLAHAMASTPSLSADAAN